MRKSVLIRVFLVVVLVVDLQNEPGTVAAAARSQHACRRELVLYPGSSSV